MSVLLRLPASASLLLVLLASVAVLAWPALAECLDDSSGECVSDDVAFLQQGLAKVTGARGKVAAMAAEEAPPSQPRSRAHQDLVHQEEPNGLNDLSSLFQSSFLRNLHAETQKHLAKGKKAQQPLSALPAVASELLACSAVLRKGRGVAQQHGK